MRVNKPWLLRFLASGALLMLLMAIYAPAALAKSWSISRVVIDAALQADGSLMITEHRTFRFDGSFSHIYQEIIIPERSSIGPITVADEAGPYQEGVGTVPGTFTVSFENGNMLVDWYFRAADTEKTFTITYQITDAVRLYRDRAELDWDFIGAKWEAETAAAEVRLSLPVDAIQAQVAAPDATIEAAGANVHVTAGPLPAGERLRVRVDLPRAAFPNAPIIPEAGPTDIIVQMAWVALATILGMRFYFAHVKRARPDPSRIGPPQPLPAVLVARFTGQDLNTGLRTLLADLSNRGLLQYQPLPDGDWLCRRLPERYGLQPYEAKALDLFFGPDRIDMTLAEWTKSMAKNHTRYSELTSWWDELKKQLPDRWFLSWRWDLILVLLTLLPVLLLTILSPVAAVAGVAAIGLLVLSIKQRRYTDEGYEQKAAWAAVAERLQRSMGAEEVALALALGLKPAGTHAEDEEEDGEVDDAPNIFRWLYVMNNTFVATFATFESSDSSSGGGDGGGDGGGGGGAE